MPHIPAPLYRVIKDVTQFLSGESIWANQTHLSLSVLTRLDRTLRLCEFWPRCGFWCALIFFWVVGIPSLQLHAMILAHSEKSVPTWLYPVTRVLQAFLLPCLYADPLIANQLGYPEKKGWLDTRPNHTQATRKLKNLSVDYLVIGSGAGGAVVADTLAARGRDVLILEEGENFSTKEFSEVNSYDRAIHLSRGAGINFSIGSPPVLIPIGKAVGGTTLMNSGTCFRLPESVLLSWRELYKLKGITTENLRPHFDFVENRLKVQPVPAGARGPNFHLIDHAVHQLGHQGKSLLRNAEGCVGSGECCYGCPTGAKLSTEKSFIPSALQNGAKVMTSHRVHKLVIKNNRITTVVIARLDPVSGREIEKIKLSPNHVVSSCGTFHSPQLLWKSGLRHRELGRNLTIHPTGKAVGIFDRILDGHQGVPQGYQSDYLHEHGIMFETIFYPPWLMALNHASLGEDHANFMREYRRLGVFAFLISDRPNGHMHFFPGGKFLIRYDFSERERKLYVEGVIELARILFAAGAKQVLTGIRDFQEISNSAALANISRKKIPAHHLETAAFHPLGTCRMGHDPKNSVVDENLKVHGIDNLYVADGSIFPSSLGVNPQISIMAFAHRLGHHLSSDSP